MIEVDSIRRIYTLNSFARTFSKKKNNKILKHLKRNHLKNCFIFKGDNYNHRKNDLINKQVKKNITSFQ